MQAALNSQGATNVFYFVFFLVFFLFLFYLLKLWCFLLLSYFILLYSLAADTIYFQFFLYLYMTSYIFKKCILGGHFLGAHESVTRWCILHFCCVRDYSMPWIHSLYILFVSHVIFIKLRNNSEHYILMSDIFFSCPFPPQSSKLVAKTDMFVTFASSVLMEGFV